MKEGLEMCKHHHLMKSSLKIDFFNKRKFSGCSYKWALWHYVQKSSKSVRIHQPFIMVQLFTLLCGFCQPDWFKVIFPSDWMRSWAVILMLSQYLGHNQRAATAKAVVTGPGKADQMQAAIVGVLVSAASDTLNLQSNPLCVSPLLLCYHLLLCKATHGLLSAEDFVTCRSWTPGGNGLLHLSSSLVAEICGVSHSTHTSCVLSVPVKNLNDFPFENNKMHLILFVALQEPEPPCPIWHAPKCCEPEIVMHEVGQGKSLSSRSDLTRYRDALIVGSAANSKLKLSHLCCKLKNIHVNCGWGSVGALYLCCESSLRGMWGQYWGTGAQLGLSWTSCSSSGWKPMSTADKSGVWLRRACARFAWHFREGKNTYLGLI